MLSDQSEKLCVLIQWVHWWTCKTYKLQKMTVGFSCGCQTQIVSVLCLYFQKPAFKQLFVSSWCLGTVSSVRAHEITIFVFVNALFESRIPVFRTVTDNIMISFCHCRMPGFYSLFLWLTETLNPCLNTKNWPGALWIWAFRRNTEIACSILWCLRVGLYVVWRYSVEFHIMIWTAKNFANCSKQYL